MREKVKIFYDIIPVRYGRKLMDAKQIAFFPTLLENCQALLTYPKGQYLIRKYRGTWDQSLKVYLCGHHEIVPEEEIDKCLGVTASNE